MKKFIIFLFATMLITCSAAQAATTIEVEAVTSFESASAVNTMKVISRQDVDFENGISFKNGTILEGKVIDVKQPKRGKRNASFKFQPTSYTYNGRTTQIYDEDFVAKYSAEKSLDKKQLATSAATTAGGMLLNIPFFSQGVSLIKGVAKNEEDNRIKSGVVQVYKDSPLAYVEEGKEISIKPDDIFYLKFKTHKAEDLDAEDDETYIETPVNTVKETKTETREEAPVIPGNLKSPHPDEVLREVELNSK